MTVCWWMSYLWSYLFASVLPTLHHGDLLLCQPIQQIHHAVDQPIRGRKALLERQQLGQAGLVFGLLWCYMVAGSG